MHFLRVAPRAALVKSLGGIDITLSAEAPASLDPSLLDGGLRCVLGLAAPLAASAKAGPGKAQLGRGQAQSSVELSTAALTQAKP
jgi:hypothetical protein